MMFFGIRISPVVCHGARSMRQDGNRARRNGSTDFPEVFLHGVSICKWHGQTGSDASTWANGTKQIQAFIALILGLAGARPFPRPLIDDAVLLPDPHLILPPYLNRRIRGQMPYRSRQRAGEVFLKASMTSAFCPGC